MLESLFRAIHSNDIETVSNTFPPFSNFQIFVVCVSDQVFSLSFCNEFFGFVLLCRFLMIMEYYLPSFVCSILHVVCHLSRICFSGESFLKSCFCVLQANVAAVLRTIFYCIGLFIQGLTDLLENTMFEMLSNIEKFFGNLLLLGILLTGMPITFVFINSSIIFLCTRSIVLNVLLNNCFATRIECVQFSCLFTFRFDIDENTIINNARLKSRNKHNSWQSNNQTNSNITKNRQNKTNWKMVLYSRITN